MSNKKPTSNGKILMLPPNRANGIIRGKLNTPQEVAFKLKKFKIAPSELVPVDWRKIMREYGLELSKPQDQHMCGNCWALASLCSLRDRWEFKLKRNGLDLTPLLGTQCADLLNNGCDGGHPENAIEFFANYGVVLKTESCPSLADICHTDKCTGVGFPRCDDLKNNCYKQGSTIFRAKHPRKAQNRGSTTLASTDNLTTIYNMKAELQDRTYGGVFCAVFLVPWDLSASSAGYKWEKTNGIFITGEYDKELDALGIGQIIKKPENSKWTDFSGAHCIEIVGWDKENVPGYGTVSYWILKNTWGVDWMDGGYMKFACNDKADGKGWNWTLGLDIPIKDEMNNYFGSGTVAEPDLDNFTGLTDNDEKLLKRVRSISNQESKTDSSMKIFFFLLVLLCTIAVVYLVMK